MTKTELLNQTARDESERLLLARTLDKLEAAERRGFPAHTGFLSPREREAVARMLHAAGEPRHLFFGGFEQAERTICAFLPDWQAPEDWFMNGECPVSVLRCTFSPEQKLTHRDFLGSVLGLGVTREKVGDLLVDNGSCDLILLRELVPFLMLNLERVGRGRVKLEPVALDRLRLPQAQVKEIRDTVATLRLDAVAAVGFSLSRSRASELIAQGRVQVNHIECIKPDKPVGQGDAIACRGLGKCLVKEVGGLSRKGRIILVMERYI